VSARLFLVSFKMILIFSKNMPNPNKKLVRKTKKEKLREKYVPKQEFIDRIEVLLGKEEAKEFFDISYFSTPSAIRCNTLKISPSELKERLDKKGWKLKQPFKEIGHDEIFVLEERLSPGELGKTKEHLLGYFYVQEISSMLPLLALGLGNEEIYLDLCASPGSKTTQAAALMENKGLIIANDNSIGRLRILNSNLERCGVSNTIVTRKDGVQLCKKLRERTNLKFDKILVDAPCSGEGTLRKSLATFNMWNKKTIINLSSLQKRLAVEALRILKVGGEMIYSTCTLSPEEDEEVVDFLIKNFDIKIEEVSLPLKLRKGILEWEGKNYDHQVKNCVRLYPQDNNTDGFFLAKIKKLSDKCSLEVEK